jgi:hypothetical protein
MEMMEAGGTARLKVDRTASMHPDWPGQIYALDPAIESISRSASTLKTDRCPKNDGLQRRS